MSNLIHEAALQYATQGIAIFPCRARDKRPATQHGLKDASADFKQVCQWWHADPTYNIGLPCGAINSVVVIDIDGDEGRATWRKQCQQHGEVKTLTASTGKGLHLYFASPGLEIKNAVRLLPGIDVRADGGYVIAPPSVHPSGAVYAWADTDSPKDFLPAWLLEMLLTREAVAIEPKAPAQQTPSPRDVQGHIKERAIIGALTVLKTATEGERNSRLYWTACRLFDYGYGLADVQGALSGLATSKGLSESEALKTIGSAQKQGRRPVRA